MPRIVDPIEPAAEREAKFQPRYVEVPALREHGFGRRNLAWGVITLVLGIGLLAAAVYFSGQKAVLSLAACLFTFTALFVLSRLHIFRQRNGGFLAISVVVLLGAIVPLIDRGYEKLAGHATPAPPAPAPAAPPAEVEPPLLKQSFALTNPEADQTQVRVLKDARVLIGEKPFLIKEGDAFPLLEAKGGEVTFAVRDLHVSLPVTGVEILGGKSGKETRETAMAAALAAATGIEPARPEPGASPAKPSTETPTRTPAAPAAPGLDLAAITRSAQQEAMRRYPALGVKESTENVAYLAAYREMKESGKADFFANPEWPIELAEVLAIQNRWARGDQPAPVPAFKNPVQRLDPPMDDDPVAPAPAADDTRLPQVLPQRSEPPQVPRMRGR